MKSSSRWRVAIIASAVLFLSHRIAVGGVLFAWVFARWNDNLWVPLGLHDS